MSTLPKEVTDRIKKEAEEFLTKTPSRNWADLRLGYITGAEKEAQRCAINDSKAISIVYWHNARNMTQEEFTNWFTSDK